MTASQGAERAIHAAQNCMNSGDFELALFSCHLAVEKQLKSLYVTQNDADPPKTHKLIELCELVHIQLSEEDYDQLNGITAFAAFARYGNESWIEMEATKSNCEHWIQISTNFLHRFV